MIMSAYCAVMQACSVSSETMPRPKKRRWRVGAPSMLAQRLPGLLPPPEDDEARAIMRDALHGARTRLLACFPRNRLSPVARGELEALEGHLRALSERLGKTLPYDTLHQVRARLIAVNKVNGMRHEASAGGKISRMATE